MPIFNVETVFLDAGGVLVWPNWKRMSAALRKHGVNIEPEALAAADPIARYALDRAEVTAGSVDRLGLGVGAEVWASCKAVEVRLMVHGVGTDTL
jgi:hypothetical protein